MRLLKDFLLLKVNMVLIQEKALKKLLPLLREGRYWKWNDIDEKSKTRIEKIMTR